MRPDLPRPTVIHLLTALLAATVLGGLALTAAAAETKEARISATAAAAVLPFKQSLLKTLTAALAKEGPLAALKVCKDQAPALAAAAQTPKLTLGRTSDRLRNPANAPRAWVKPLLADYVGKTAKDAPAHKVVQIDKATWGYVEPLWVQPPCLTCHGAAVAPDVAAGLTREYPSDAATGYKEGDFRGLVWVEVKD